MELISRLLPLKSSTFPPPLRTTLLSNSPQIFEENLPASYILREPAEITHNATRAAIAVTNTQKQQQQRLVVVMGKVKKIDILLDDPRWWGVVSVWSDREDRVVFLVLMGVVGSGPQGTELEIRVRTKSAGRMVELVSNGRKERNSGR